MKKFIFEYGLFRELKRFDNAYRFCWINYKGRPGGCYYIADFNEDEINKIDQNKIEIIVY